MNKRLVIPAIVLLLLGIGAVLFFLNAPDGSTPPRQTTQSIREQNADSNKRPQAALQNTPALDVSRLDQPLIVATGLRGVHTVEGLVMDEDNAVAPGAMVYVGTVPPRTVKADESGFFSLRQLPNNRVRISARLGDRVAAPMDIDVANNPTDVVLRLRHTPQLRVQVANSEGEPVRSARVELRGTSTATARTDETGLATLPTEGPAVYVVSVVAKGYGRTLTRFEFPQNAQQYDLDVALTGGGDVRGTVVSESGKAIPRTRVWYAPTHTPSGLAQEYLRDAVETDDRGEFLLSSIRFGTIRVFAQHEDFAPVTSEAFNLSPHHPAPKLRLVLSAGARISGRVEQPNGKAAKRAAVRVVAKRQVSGLRPAWETMTDEQGSFAIKGLRPGLMVVSAELGESSAPTTELQVKAGSSTKGLRLVLENNQTVSGRTVDAAGQPVPGARVSALRANRSRELNSLIAAPPHATNSDDEGYYSISGLPAGKLHLFASREGSQDIEQILYGKTPIVVEAGAQNVDIVLPSYGRVRGQVNYADGSGTPAIFSLGSGTGAMTTFRNRDGSFELTKVQAGQVALRVSGPDFSNRVLRGVEVKADETTDLGSIAVSRGRTVSGQVLDAKGNPVPNAEVYAGKRLIANGSGFTTRNWGLAGTGDESRMTKADASGRFEFQGFGTRGLAIAAQDPDGGRSDVFRVPPGKASHRVDLIVGQGKDLTVLVLRGGQAVPGVAVNISPIPSSNHSNFVAKTNEEGVATFNTMRPSNYAISAMFGMSPIVGIAQFGKKFEFDPNGETRAQLELPEKTVSTEILALDEAQQPFEMVEIHTFAGKVSAKDANALRRLADEFSGGFYAFNIGLGAMGSKVKHLAAQTRYTSCAVPFPSNIANQDAAVVKKYATSKGKTLAAYCKTYQTAGRDGKLSILATRPPDADLQTNQKQRNIR